MGSVCFFDPVVGVEREVERRLVFKETGILRQLNI
jgi:hypothetical protein